MIIKTSIIPDKQLICRKKGSCDLNLKALTIFAAIGFFLEKDVYYTNEEALQPFTKYEIDENNFITKSGKYWDWNYNPKDISLKQATEEFAHLFEKLSNENLKDKNIILPLSGGLDSRTQAVFLKKEMRVNCYSYKFEDSFDETKYGREISKVKSFPFTEYIIEKSYLWKIIEELAEINQCYADFTNPRQMAVIDKVEKLGDIFYLGHWGDVLFDSMDIKDDTPFDEQLNSLMKKLLKRGGEELAQSLWASWGLEGNFKEYFRERLSNLLEEIKIDNANSRIRAFKSTYWAPRWTSINMKIFSDHKPIFLPYYSDELCRFVCTIPENLLAGRQIQIEYIKMNCPELAKISWQPYEPLNLYNYKKFENSGRLGIRAYKKIDKLFKEKILRKKNITRNWELQFSGKKNTAFLEKYLFENKNFAELIPPPVIKKYYDKFRYEDPVYYSHPVNILLTLSLFCKLKGNKTI